MELRGTLQSIQDAEKILAQSLPSKVVHIGGNELDGPDKSVVYTKVYQLFPDGTGLWDTRVNVRFYYDDPRGIGTVKISAKGVELLQGKLTKALAKITGIEKLVDSN